MPFRRLLALPLVIIASVALPLAVCAAPAATSTPADIEARIAELITQLSTEEKAVQLASSYPNGNARLGIPQLVAGEALHGVCLPDATCFPQAIGLAATRDPELVERIAATIAREARALGMHQTFGPMLGLARDPRWGRVEESFGEDPWLVSRIGVAYVRGMQGVGPERYGPDKIICTPKHFVADGESLRGGNGEAVEISETTLRESAFLPFEAVIRESGAVAIPWLAKNIPSIVSAWYAGQETGNAVARVLFGAVNPGGKLPVTFPSSTGMVPCYYNALPPSGPQSYLEGPFRVTFPFGPGLSYTTFKFGSPRLAATSMLSDNFTQLTVPVTNTGSRAGDEVIQLYVKRRYASSVRPLRELKGFARITLQPGETREVVVLPVGFEQLKSWLDGRWQVEPGEFVLQVGPDSVAGQDVTLTVR